MASVRGTGDPAAAPVPTGRLHGVIDVLRPNRIAGWAIDRADERAAVRVDILREGRVIATLTADRHRPDLEKGGIGTGRYGFLAPLDPALDPGFEFTVAAVARTADGHALTLAPVGSAVPDVPPDLRLMQRLFQAVVDLRTAVTTAAATPPAPATDPALAALTAAVERIELVQARIEARLDAIDRPAAPPRDPRFRGLAALALAVAAASLAAGLWSLWG